VSRNIRKFNSDAFGPIPIRSTMLTDGRVQLNALLLNAYDSVKN